MRGGACTSKTPLAARKDSGLQRQIEHGGAVKSLAGGRKRVKGTEKESDRNLERRNALMKRAKKPREKMVSAVK